VSVLLQSKQGTALKRLQLLSSIAKQVQPSTIWFTAVVSGAATHAWYSTNRLAVVVFGCVKL